MQGPAVTTEYIMAEFKFTCSHCKQGIVCDELWSGHEIQCPHCQGTLTVPARKAEGSARSLVPAPPPGTAPKVSLGRPQSSPSSSVAQVLAEAAARRAAGGPVKKSNWGTWIGIVVALAALGVGGYFGYGWYRDRAEAKKREAEQSAAANAQTNMLAAPAPPAAEKPLALLPAVWTLAVETANIPKGGVNGTLSGAKFVPETTRLDQLGAVPVLRFFQGAATSPDQEVLIYLRLNPGETLAGRTWTVSKEERGAAVPEVAKRWKSNPAAPPQLKMYNSGYAMKLELGQAADGALPGKIFIALPDQEQSVLAGLFKATTGVTSTGPEATSAQPAAPPAEPALAPAPAPGAPMGGRPPPSRSQYENRYGKQR